MWGFFCTFHTLFFFLVFFQDGVNKSIHLSGLVVSNCTNYISNQINLNVDQTIWQLCYFLPNLCLQSLRSKSKGVMLQIWGTCGQSFWMKYKCLVDSYPFTGYNDKRMDLFQFHISGFDENNCKHKFGRK